MPPETPQTSSPAEGTIVGGPYDNSGAPKEVAPTQSEPPKTAEPAAVTPAQPSPIYVGGKKFTNQDEMISYFSQIEAERQQRQPTPAAEINPEKALAELMYEDPAAYQRAILDQAENRAMSKINQQRSHEQAWEAFYKKYPDLNQDRDVVGLMYQNNAPKLDKMHLDQAMDELAKASRGRIAKFRQIPSEGKPLPSGPAVTTGSSGGPGIVPQVTQQSMTLVDQMAAMRAKRRKA